MASDRRAHGRTGGPARGFSMIEVLVTLLIVSLALLGTAGLQAYSMRQNQSSKFRTQAVLLAADLAERMEANKTGAVAGAYALPMTKASDYTVTSSSGCIDAACSRTDLAAFDLVQWQNAAADPQNLPQSSWQIVWTPGNPSVYTITIGWVDRTMDTTNAAYDSTSQLGSNAAGTGERFFYTATRTVLD